MKLMNPVQILRALNIRSMDDFKRQVEIAAEMSGTRHRRAVFTARVEHGRCIADCPCGSGIAIHPDWPEAGCLECGRWGDVVMPENFTVLEAVLIARPDRVNQNWRPGETIDQLAEENHDRGLPRVIDKLPPRDGGRG